MLIYTVKYTCSNCGHNFGKEFPKGQKADSKVVCPNCECLAGGKDWNQPYTDYRWPVPYLYYYPSPEPQKLLWEPNYGYDFKTTGVGWLEVSPINI